MTTVFMTGASGFIGRAVLREILKRLSPEDRVISLVRDPIEPEDRRVVALTGDLASLDAVDSYIRTADYIVHVAGEARLNGEYDYYGTNVAPTQKLVDSARKNNRLRRFIFISSIAAMDRSPADRCQRPLTVDSPCNPRTGYGMSKREAEEIILRSGLPYTVFRPGFVYGAGMRDNSHLRRFALLIRRGIPLHRIGFPGKISLIHVDDLASAVAGCLSGDTGRDRIYLAETEYMPLGHVLALLGEVVHGRHSAFQLRLPAMVFFQRLYSKLPMTIAGLFLDSMWMDDPSFKNDFIDALPCKTVADTAHDIFPEADSLNPAAGHE
jgi:nucleoside-diphosphate-sugar epimerase